MKLTVTWLTVISFIFNLVLSGLSFYQYLDSRKQEENLKLVVRSWQNQAEGLSTSLSSISYNPQNFSTKEDMAQAVAVASSYAFSLNNALSQQRFYTDEEIKVKKEDSARYIQQMFEVYKQSTPSGGPR